MVATVTTKQKTPRFGQAGSSGLNGGFGAGGGQSGFGYTYPGWGGFGGGGEVCNGYDYDVRNGREGFGSGGGYGGHSFNASGMGGAVFIRSGLVRFENSLIENNLADASGDAKGLGGGLFILQKSNENGFSGRGIPENMAAVSGCRLIFANNQAKSSDNN